MNFYKCLNKTRLALVWVIILLSLGMLFVFADECKNGAVYGILLCFGVLVPSLFPFFILSSFVAESGACESLHKLLNPVSKLLLGARGICLMPYLLSLVGGYPVGARAISALYNRKCIRSDEAKLLSYICVGAGPGFLVTYIGISLLNSKESGIILLCSQIISMLITSILSKIFIKESGSNAEVYPPVCNIKISEALVGSVYSAVKSTASMCGYVIAFSVICNILTEGFAVDSVAGDIAVAILEITTGVSNLSGKVSLELISALTAFGGICVHMQIFRELKGIDFSKIRFYLFRFIQAVISYISTKTILLIYPVSESVFSTVNEEPRLTIYSSVIGCVALTLTSALFILITKNKATNRR